MLPHGLVGSSCLTDLAHFAVHLELASSHTLHHVPMPATHQVETQEGDVPVIITGWVSKATANSGRSAGGAASASAPAGACQRCPAFCTHGRQDAVLTWRSATRAKHAFGNRPHLPNCNPTCPPPHTRAHTQTHNPHPPAGDRQFFFLNGRPIDLPRATKALNETYRSLSSPAAASSKPMAVVDFRWAGQGRVGGLHVGGQTWWVGCTWPATWGSRAGRRHQTRAPGCRAGLQGGGSIVQLQAGRAAAGATPAGRTGPWHACCNLSAQGLLLLLL